jgi:hypothetical protein
MGKHDEILKLLTRAPLTREESEYDIQVKKAIAHLRKVSEMPNSLPDEEHRREDTWPVIPGVKPFTVRTEDHKSLACLVREWHRLRAHKDLFEDVEKLLNLQLRAISDMIQALLDSEGQSSIKLEEGIGVRSQPDVIGLVEDPQKFYDWVHQQKLDSLLSMHHGRLATIVKERLHGNLALPDGVKAHFRPKLVKT